MEEIPENIDIFLRQIGVGVRPINDPFFDESHRVCKVTQRTGVVVEDDEELCHQMMNEFNCNAPGCTAKFQNLLDFEVHYNSTHRFTCVECKKTKPNSRLLEIHIQEAHDSFFKTIAEKEPMYQCYVSDCNIKFKDAAERKEHCIKYHKFPKHFKFDERSQIKKAKDVKKNKKADTSMEVDEAVDEKINKKYKIKLNKNQKARTFISNMKKVNEAFCGSSEQESKITTSSSNTSVLQFIPRQLNHKSYSRVLTQNKVIQPNANLESTNMMDLEEALHDCDEQSRN